MRMTSDNVLIRMDSPVDEVETGLVVFEAKPHMTTRPWFATVLSVGPGYRAEKGACKFVRTTLVPGQRLLVVDAQVGQKVEPRQVGQEEGDFRIVREGGTDVIAVLS